MLPPVAATWLFGSHENVLLLLSLCRTTSLLENGA